MRPRGRVETRATFFSPTNEWCLPAPSVIKPVFLLLILSPIFLTLDAQRGVKHALEFAVVDRAKRRKAMMELDACVSLLEKCHPLGYDACIDSKTFSLASTCHFNFLACLWIRRWSIPSSFRFFQIKTISTGKFVARHNDQHRETCDSHAYWSTEQKATTTNGPNHGPVWKTQSFLLSEIFMVIL